MKFVVITADPHRLEVAFQLQQEKHQVRLFGSNLGGSQLGIIDRLSTPSEILSWEPDLVIFPTPTAGLLAADLSKDGKGLPVFGGGAVHDRLNGNGNNNYWIPLATNVITDKSILPNVFVTKIPAMALHHVTSTDPDKSMTWKISLREKAREFEVATGDVVDFLDENLFPGADPLITIRPVNTEGEVVTLAVMASWHGFCNPMYAVQSTKGLFNGGIQETEGVRLAPIDVTGSLSDTLFKPLEKLFRAIKYVGWLFFDLRVTESGIVLDGIRSTVPEGFWAAFIATLSKDFGGIFPRVTKPGRRGRERKVYLYPAQEGKAYRVTVPPYPINRCVPSLNDLQIIDSSKFQQRPENLLITAGIQMVDSSVRVTHPEIGWMINKGPIRQTVEFLAEQIPEIQVRTNHLPLHLDSLGEYGINKHKGENENGNGTNSSTPLRTEGESGTTECQRTGHPEREQQKEDHHGTSVRRNRRRVSERKPVGSVG